MDAPFDLVLAVAAGIAVSAATGLRAFLPLFVLGAASRFAGIELHPAVTWLASTPALVAFGTATVIEMAADKVPVLDHALDAVGAFLKPVAGWIAGIAVLAPMHSPWAEITAIALGGGALAVGLAKAKVRLGSSVTTLGHGNPVLSALEDAGTFLLLVIAVLAPLIALAAAGVLVYAIVRARRPSQRRDRSGVPTHTG